MTLSEVEIFPIKPRGSLVGFLSFVLDGMFYVGGIAIHMTPEGTYRLIFPDKSLPNGKRIQLFHPISERGMTLLTSAVAQRFEQLQDSSTAGLRRGDTWRLS